MVFVAEMRHSFGIISVSETVMFIQVKDATVSTELLSTTLTSTFATTCTTADYLEVLFRHFVLMVRDRLMTLEELRIHD